MLHTLQRYLQQTSLSTIGSLATMLLLCVFLSDGLLACGSNSGSGSGSAQNPTPTASAQAQKCGVVQTNPRGVPIGVINAKQSEDCFSQAYQKCQPASLIYIMTSVDTVLTRTFTIQNNGGQCSISDAVQHAIVPAKPSPAKTYTCTGLTAKSNGLLILGCGQDGDVILPAQ